MNEYLHAVAVRFLAVGKSLARAVCCAVLVLVPASAPVRADEAGGAANSHATLEASPEPGWPQWRGPRRDAICDETGLLKSWPEGGPKLLWKTSDLGRGYCAPVITGGRIYLAGDVADQLRIFALNLDGRRVGQSSNGKAWQTPYPGARAVCAYRDGRLYQLNAHGRLACLDAASGTELWAVNVVEEFGGRVNTWAYSECVLVDGARVIVTPGGTRALMAALDARSGRTVWATEPLRFGKPPEPSHERVTEPEGEADSASYASPILFTLGGRRQLVNCSQQHVFGVDAGNGKLLWTRPLRTRYQVVVSTPLLVEDGVFVTAPDTEDARLYRLMSNTTGVNAQARWSTPLDTCHGGVVLKDGAIFGSWYRRRSKGFACVNARDGTVRYELTTVPKGSILYADERLYCLCEDGEMILLRPAADHFEFTGRFRLVPERTSDAWTHPVILDRKLYLRYHDTLYCYDVAAR